MILEYLKIIKKYYQLIILFSVLLAVATFFFTVRQSARYSSSLSLLVSNNQVQETSDYRFDGYYEVQAADLFSNTVEAWFRSPEVVSAIYEKALVNLDRSNIKELTKIFRSEKLAPHYVEVRYKTNNETESKQIALAIDNVLAEKTRSLREVSENKTSFSVKGGAPVTVLTKPPIFINTITALVMGLFLGFLIGIIKEYLKETPFNNKNENIS